jgi:hypothetical protein
MEEIINKVANSAGSIRFRRLLSGIRSQVDISQWLLEAFIERKKILGNILKNHDWTQYQDQFVAVNCSTDAIVPAWASSSYNQLAPFAKKIINGNIDDLNAALYEELLAKIVRSMLIKQLYKLT